MAVPFQNVWQVRTVAETSAKSCFVCYKPTPKVLITPDSKDFFYICASHLTDKGFASPIIDAEAEAARLKKEAMDKEIAKIKAEYEEKQKKKKSKKQEKNGKEKDKKEDEDEKERDEQIKSVTGKADDTSKADEGPRTYSLQRNFYQMRIDRLRNIEQAKRNQERLKNPTLFPSVPKNDLT